MSNSDSIEAALDKFVNGDTVPNANDHRFLITKQDLHNMMEAFVTTNLLVNLLDKPLDKGSVVFLKAAFMKHAESLQTLISRPENEDAFK